MTRTVLITGASSGIGDAFARVCAARGDDLVITARNTERLESLATELRSSAGVTVEVITADLSTDTGVKALETRIRSTEAPPIDLLINNAGFGTGGAFHALPGKAEEREIKVNVLALVRLTHAALGPMVARGSGAVINVASLAAYQPLPFGATYGATKAFVLSFGSAVNEELRGTGVHITTVCPGFTRTEFQERAGTGIDDTPDWLWMTADAVARDAVRACDRRRALCIPGRKNQVAAGVSSVLPNAVTNPIVRKLTNGRV